MGRFNEYAQRVNGTVYSYFEAHEKAAAALEKAEIAKKLTPVRVGVGMVNAEYAAKAARAEADFLEANNQYNAITRNAAEKTRNELANIRAELEKAIDKVYGVDPSKVDMATIELLKSGILKPSEYAHLIESAEKNENFVMVRVIAKHIESLAKSEKDESRAKELRALAIKASRATGSDYMQAFEFMADLYERCVRTPRLFQDWDRLTENARNIL